MARFLTVAGTVLQWLLWVICVVLIIPVLMGVPGKPTDGEAILYLAVLGAVTAYPVGLPVLAVLEHLARRRAGGPGMGIGALRALSWVAFAVVLLVLGIQAWAFHVHERDKLVQTPDEYRSNAYANAILRHDTAWMDRLIAEGASVDHPLAQGDTPALLAAAFGDWTLVEFLLGRGANPDRVNARGESVRALAATPSSPPTKAAEQQALARVRNRLRLEPPRPSTTASPGSLHDPS